MIPTELQKFAESKGVRLETSETGFARADAVEALGLLEGTNACVYGGDVYQKQRLRWIPTYDNWYCERSPNESDLEFAKRSRARALDYISQYSRPVDPVLFILVF